MPDLGGGNGGKAFQFIEVGDGFDGGVVVSAELRQQTTMEDGVPLVFYKKKPTPVDKVPEALVGNCDPVPALWVEVQTTLRNHEGLESPMDGGDDGTRTIVFSGHKFIELKKVTRSVNEGDVLSVRMTGLGDPPQKGYSRPKQFDGGIKHQAAPKGVNLDTGKASAAASTADASQVANRTTAVASSESAASGNDTTDGVEHGPKPDYVPDAAWAKMGGEARRAIAEPIPF